MADADFVRDWLGRLERETEKLPTDARREILEGGEDLSESSSPRELADWMRRALRRLEEHLGETGRAKTIAGCGCSPGAESLERVRALYAETSNVDRCIEALQTRFVRMLGQVPELDAETIAKIVRRGLGMAGTRKGNTITTTKIPSRANISAYFRESDPVRRRKLYCHCPWGRALLDEGASDLSAFCNCGAGYYKNIWEIILQKPVEMRLVESVLRGDDVCRAEILLPAS